MSEKLQDPQDPIIRTVLISGAIFAVLGFIATVLVVAALISANFNVMNWLE
jgi:hypothetical protein